MLILYQLEIKMRKLLALLNSQVCNVRFFQGSFSKGRPGTEGNTQTLTENDSHNGWLR
jgi:hypothetical protein